MLAMGASLGSETMAIGEWSKAGRYRPIYISLFALIGTVCHHYYIKEHIYNNT